MLPVLTAWHAGFVPGDAPGADSYFTPAANVEAGNASLNKQRSAQRCSVINALDGALLTHPMRHRTSSMKLHKVALREKRCNVVNVMSYPMRLLNPHMCSAVLWG